MDENLTYILTETVMMTQASQQRIANQGIVSSNEIALVDMDALMDCFSSTNKPTVLVAMRLRALKQWIDMQYDVHGPEPDVRDPQAQPTWSILEFTPEVCQAIQRTLAKSKKGSSIGGNAEGSKGEASSDMTKIKFNGKPAQWEDCKRSFVSRMNQIKNDDGVPLYYVIRDPLEEEDFRTKYGIIGTKIYDAPLKGPRYQTDSFRVLQMLKEWVAGGTASTFVEDAANVQEAWNGLIVNYDGADAIAARVQKARNDIMTSHYTQDTVNFSFQDYCTRILRANNELDRYNANVDGRSQVTDFLKGIKTDNRTSPIITSIKTNIASDSTLSGDLRKAIEKFKETMTKLGINPSNTKNARRVGASSRNPGGGRGRGRGRNDSRYHPQGRGHGGGRGNGGRGRGGGDGKSSYFIKEETLQHLTPVQRKMIFMGRSLLEEQEQGTPDQRSQGSSKRSNEDVATEDGPATETTNSETANGNEGNASARFGSQGNKRNRTQGSVQSKGRRFIGGSKSHPSIQHSFDHTLRARAEMDSRADTVCAGATFELHYATGKVADVSGFHPTMNSISNVPIGTAITAVDLANETVILVFNEALYFGAAMEESLVPPAQLWDHGVICDITPKVHSGGNSIHGIFQVEDNVYIPFGLHGCISHFVTRLPTTEEKQNCRWITLTSDREWKPYSEEFALAEAAAVGHFTDPYQQVNRSTVDNMGKLVDPTGNNRYVSAITTATVSHQDDFMDDVLLDNLDARIICATSSKERRSSVTHDTLARRWGTSIYMAEQAMKATTQRGIRYMDGNLTQRFRTRQRQLQSRYLRTKVYTDTMFSSTTSTRGNNCAQLFVTSEGFAAGDPLNSKSLAHEFLEKFCRQFGIPSLLISDGAKEEQFGEWGRVVKENLIQTRLTEPHSAWQNRCEDEIREIKKHHRRIMALHECPEVFWDFGWQYTLELRQFLPRKAADGRPPYETLTGEAVDISEYLEFDFYDWVLYRDRVSYPEDPVKLGRWLGVAHSVGAPMTYWVLKENGQVISRSTVQRLTREQLHERQDARTRFTQAITERFGAFDPDIFQVFDRDDPEDPSPRTDQGANDSDSVDLTTADAEEHDGWTLFKNAEVILPHGDRQEIAKIIGRKRNADGLYVGRAHSNPALDSRVFTARFPDGEEKDIAFNILAEHLYSQVDSEGRQQQIFREIIAHRRNKRAVDKADQFRTLPNGRRIQKKTTAGWDLEIEWKDGSTSWLTLKELKETNPIEVALYAVANRIDDEPAFSWWVKQVLKKRQRLIKVMKTANNHFRKHYKFGIRMSRTVKEALALDQEIGNSLWLDAIKKEMGNVRVAFESKGVNGKAPPGYKRVDLMMVFDLKMDFTRKARLCARGDQTDPPNTLTYSSVVSRESVRIAFLVAALNDLELTMFDIGNAYLNAPTTEKLYTVAGPEFGDNEEGHTMVIVRALYGLKSSGAAYRSHFAQTLRDLGFTSCLADADVWRREATKENGFQYYEYILTYVDDCLIVSENPGQIINCLKHEFGYLLKDVGPPNRYLGATTGQRKLDNGQTAWYMSASLYLGKAIKEIEETRGNLSKMFSRQHLDTPLPPNYHPELDDSKFLDDDERQLYQSYIGIIRWAVELGRIDLAHAAGLMARFAATPREGHMVQVIRILAYTKKHIDSKIVFDAGYVDMDDIVWNEADWSEFYPDVMGKEPLPPNMPTPRGNTVDINMFCDAAHATCDVTRRSTTGIIFFINGAPVSWYSKRQNTIESSVFGSEYVALKIAAEQNDALRYKLRMLGIPIAGPTNGFCDNRSVVINSTIPQSTLQKKHNMIAYHR
eukprot:Nitzschia sp. Nitz4//scaffold471_size5685//193//5616//NITZ4_009210-RA/size5685-processed-gene-0.1-mRNA-1//1//CDS//3329552692//2319//frame0